MRDEISEIRDLGRDQCFYKTQCLNAGKCDQTRRKFEILTLTVTLKTISDEYAPEAAENLHFPQSL